MRVQGKLALSQRRGQTSGSRRDSRRAGGGEHGKKLKSWYRLCVKGRKLTPLSIKRLYLHQRLAEAKHVLDRPNSAYSRVSFKRRI